VRPIDPLLRMGRDGLFGPSEARTGKHARTWS